MKTKVKKYYSVKKNKEFQTIFKKGKKAFSPALLMLYTSSDVVRLGICVSKKHGKSVARNRIKRLIREAFRGECGAINGKYNFIFVPKVDTDYTLEKYQRCLHGMLKKEKLI